MPKFIAPAIIASLSFDNVEYERDADGLFEIKHPDHIASAGMHGLVLFDPEKGEPVAQAPARIESEFDATIATLNAEITAAADELVNRDAELAKRDEEIAELRRQLSSRPASDAQDAAEGTSTATGTGSASGDTSSATEGTASTVDTGDKIGTALAANPDFEAMKRDDLTDWLKGVGVSVPGNLSEAKAREIVQETIADYKTDLAKKNG